MVAEIVAHYWRKRRRKNCGVISLPAKLLPSEKLVSHNLPRKRIQKKKKEANSRARNEAESKICARFPKKRRKTDRILPLPKKKKKEGKENPEIRRLVIYCWCARFTCCICDSFFSLSSHRFGWWTGLSRYVLSFFWSYRDRGWIHFCAGSRFWSGSRGKALSWWAMYRGFKTRQCNIDRTS